MRLQHATIPCPICSTTITIPLTVTTSPVHAPGEILLNIDPDYTELRAHAASHRPPDGPGLTIAA